MTEQRLSIHISNSELENYKSVAEIVYLVEWDKVHSVMKHLSWTWYNCKSKGGIPTEDDLTKKALEQAEIIVNRTIDSKEGVRYNSGGIECQTHYFDDGSVGLKVMFILTDWDNYL